MPRTERGQETHGQGTWLWAGDGGCGTALTVTHRGWACESLCFSSQKGSPGTRVSSQHFGKVRQEELEVKPSVGSLARPCLQTVQRAGAGAGFEGPVPTKLPPTCQRHSRSQSSSKSRWQQAAGSKSPVPQLWQPKESPTRTSGSDLYTGAPSRLKAETAQCPHTWP